MLGPDRAAANRRLSPLLPTKLSLHYGSLLWRELTCDCGSFDTVADRSLPPLGVCLCFVTTSGEMSAFEKHQPSARTNWTRPSNSCAVPRAMRTNEPQPNRPTNATKGPGTMPLRQAGIAAMLPLRELLHAVGALTGMMCRKAPFWHPASHPPKRRA